MIELLAIAPEDGCAFYKDNDCIYSIHPPGWKPEKGEEQNVATAICKHGFWFSEKIFENLDQLITFLELKMVETREKGYYTP